MPISAPTTPLKPLLKWAGGKRWLLPKLIELWTPHGGRNCRLVEPFVGGLSVALGLRPDRALLNDANPHLVNLYRHLQQGLALELEMKNDADVYYAMRARFNELARTGQAHTSEAAQIFYYLNRTGFNGLCRFNNRGEFNVPFGKYKTINYAIESYEYQLALKDWEFTVGDFESLKLEPNDFIYADPPYDASFTKYSQDDFTWDDRVRLARWLARHPGRVVLSDRATDRIIELYQDCGFAIEMVDAPRRIACNGDRRPALEVIACKGFSSAR